MGVRRAFVWASAGRYTVMLLNLAATLILARLLAPSEYGVAVLGGSIFAVAEALRAVGGGAYLIQKSELSSDNIRACFTVSLIVTILVAVALLLLARPLARFFDMPHLNRYLEVAALGYLTGPFVYPISALMGRNLDFGALAVIGVMVAFINAVVGVSFAMQGFGYMSFAWASAVSTAAGMLFYLYYWKDRSIFRPLFREWRSVLSFGIYDSATGLVSQIADAVPYFIFGRLLSAEAVGLSQRAVMLCFVPERIILAGVGAVALPAFSQHTRAGNRLAPVYLRALELTTAAQWPSLVLLFVLARPITTLLLGAHWLEVVPLVHVLTIALLFSFPLVLQYATVVTVGAIRYMPLVMALQSVASIAVLTGAARHGLYAAALSTLLIVPCNGLLALSIARHFVGFRWMDVVTATRKSLLASTLAAVGPVAVMLIYGSTDQPVAATILGLLSAAAGWYAGLRLTNHPLLDEMLRVVKALRETSTAARIVQLKARFFGT
jgi:O-antigen/teichoic acid export membrane protein